LQTKQAPSQRVPIAQPLGLGPLLQLQALPLCSALTVTVSLLPACRPIDLTLHDSVWCPVAPVQGRLGQDKSHGPGRKPVQLNFLAGCSASAIRRVEHDLDL
jgi:hypothetical protein